MRTSTKIVLVVTALAILIVSPSAMAAPKPSSSSSINLIVMSTTPTAAATTNAAYGDQVTFAISTTATDRPYVLLNCYQDGVWVLAGQAGFYDANPFGKTFTLTSTAWTSGAADCTARLGSLNADGTRFHELASTSFHVDA